MASEKSIAIVLRVIEFSETSCVVTLFTRDFGKITALAKGARRPKSAFESALDLLALCRIVFLHKSPDVLDLLTEARLQRRFRSAARDLPRLYAGYYVAELLSAMTDNGDPHPELFDVADQTLWGLDTDKSPRALVLRLEMTALRLLGHLPMLDACTICGRALELGGKVHFGMLAGGLLCPACRSGQRQVVQVRGEVIRCLQQFADPQPLDGSDALPAGDVYGELRGVLNRYLTNLLGNPLKMHRYLGMLTG